MFFIFSSIKLAKKNENVKFLYLLEYINLCILIRFFYLEGKSYFYDVYNKPTILIAEDYYINEQGYKVFTKKYH